MLEEKENIKTKKESLRTYNKKKPNNEESHGAFLSVFLTLEEKDKLRIFCNNKNITVSAFVRQLIKDNTKEE